MNKTKPSSVRAAALFAGAKALIRAGRPAWAFDLLCRIKAMRVPLRDVDLLRAQCKLGSPPDAIEMLKEELRHFPDNAEAASLLASIGGERQIAGGGAGAEYEEIHRVIAPYTMVGEDRLASLFALGKRACEEDLPGHFVECGVAGGGTSALLAAVIARHSRRPRQLFSFDTFAGMPDATEHDIHMGMRAGRSGWGAGTCAAPMSSLMEVCGKLGASDYVRPVQGLFCDTLPARAAEIGAIAFLHMDGDWYESTRDILVNLYDRVVPGGLVQIDDYGFWEGCRLAVTEFEKERGITFQIENIDGTGVWFRKAR